MSPRNPNGPGSGGEDVTGEFVTLAGERYYAIRNVDRMAPFFISVVSDSDHWLFVASNGGLTAGRVSPETALFPYITVDKIYVSTPHTGSKTLLRVDQDGQVRGWEPFNHEQDGRYRIRRNLYKNVLNNKLLFEEINDDLGLVFRYCWVTSDAYGFARQCELQNLGETDRTVELLDGLQNILPAGTPRFTQTNCSYLVDAYKWNELDEGTGLGLFTLFSGITDRAEPCESLRATTVFCLGLDSPTVLLSSAQLESFRHGAPVRSQCNTRGVRGAYWAHARLTVPAGSAKHWQLVANLEQSQAEVVALNQQLEQPSVVADAIARSVDAGADALARIMAAGDGFQQTAEETVSVHHYANVQFNILRGGVFDDQYQVASADWRATLAQFNTQVFRRHQTMLESLPERLNYDTLVATIASQGDHQLTRLVYEYLPIRFGRRHGDPSRPWNQFAIELKDEQGQPLLSYQGNWRDIFQNWEALLFSYPGFIESVIAKFVNASTADGYNPYRITKQGIDWEVEEADDPWSYIGYWGDHQIIYLQKLLELSRQFHPERLTELLHSPLFSYANVPYRIKPFDALLKNAKSTVTYDHKLADRIDQRVAELGADGKLLLDAAGQVIQVNLLEKLLVPLLSKLGNLVVDGGIWLNTQRPEWNDANNALVGQGLSMVTLYYMRRYVVFVRQLLAGQSGAITLSREVSQWLEETAAPLGAARGQLSDGPMDVGQRWVLLVELGQAASRYREAVYGQQPLADTVSHSLERVAGLLDDALAVIDHSIGANRRPDGLYHAYNVLELGARSAAVDQLYLMLEGQVAALSSGAVAPPRAVELLEALFESSLFRADQRSFLLYPDRDLSGFLAKNHVPAEPVEALPLASAMQANGDDRVIQRDASGTYRFHPELVNVDALNARLDSLAAMYGQALETSREPLRALYESVFNHKAFTGRSGGMFAFEGLGSIYWHMVSKLLLAVQECFFHARQRHDQDPAGGDEAVCRRLGELYYRVREGIGFNKTPAGYGAFPTDPYSHTPKHAGAQQPGMTGQVKEEILTRFSELGVRVCNGAVRFEPALLRAREFLAQPRDFRYLDVAGQWQQLTIPAGGLVFCWCQVPVLYLLDDGADPSLAISWQDGNTEILPSLALPVPKAQELFRRSGRIRQLKLVLNRRLLFSD